SRIQPTLSPPNNEDITLFLFNHPPTAGLYPLSLHDALPIFPRGNLDPALDRVLLRRYEHRDPGAHQEGRHLPQPPAGTRLARDDAPGTSAGPAGADARPAIGRRRPGDRWQQFDRVGLAERRLRV